MNERLQGQTATRPQPLRAEPRVEAMASMPLAAPRSPIPPIGGPGPAAPARPRGHIAGLEAGGLGLLRSTLKAGGVAAAILTLFYLPAEYGVDPTGIGGLLGLTEMGAIKQQLYAEADAEDAALVAGAAPATSPAAVPADLAVRLAGIEAQVAAIAAVVGAGTPAASTPAPAPEVAPVVPEAAAAAPAPEEALLPEEALASMTAAPPAPETPAAPAWRDEATATLAPMEGIEIKLVMEEGQVARFEWSANGGVLNHDTHGDDGASQEISYEEGRAVPAQEGTLTAAFTGNHGWFWRNRTDAPVTLTLQTGGEYDAMLR